LKKITILIILIFSVVSNAQTTKIDILIDSIRNNQLYGTCNYRWVLKTDSPSADSLITIGKSVSGKLIPLLTSSDKGIIAHYILTRIWVDNIINGASFENFEETGIVEYNYNGLPFYEENGIMIANEEILKENKKKWAEITRK
jgi:hypothetical protein